MNRMRLEFLRGLAGVGAAVLLLGTFPAFAQTAPPLGVAATFAVLGGSTVTNTGASAIVGDLGVSPGSAVVGFPPGTVTGGTIHIADAIAGQAQSDLTTAFNLLAGEASTSNLTGQDLGGLTLTAGVYTFNSSAQLTGTLTLDAQNNSSAVFVFQIGSTLTTASNSSVLLINGGSKCNIFWQVGSSATLGTTTAFAGNILALTSITLNTGASASGRLLARNGAVTMDTNAVGPCAAACGLITLAPSTLPNGILNAPYSQTITATGGSAPYSFTVIAGAPPVGLTLSSAGVLSGTPTAAGSYTFTVRADDSVGCFGTQPYTIVVAAPGCESLIVSPSTLPATSVGIPYSQTITASGGTAPYTFLVTAGSLPPGLILAPGGLLSGTPTTSGPYSFTITATDSASCVGSQAYTFLVGSGTFSVPTLAPWSLLLLVGLLAIIGGWALRK